MFQDPLEKPFHSLGLLVDTAVPVENQVAAEVWCALLPSFGWCRQLPVFLA